MASWHRVLLNEFEDILLILLNERKVNWIFVAYFLVVNIVSCGFVKLVIIGKRIFVQSRNYSYIFEFNAHICWNSRIVLYFLLCFVGDGHLIRYVYYALNAFSLHADKFIMFLFTYRILILVILRIYWCVEVVYFNYYNRIE